MVIILTLKIMHRTCSITSGGFLFLFFSFSVNVSFDKAVSSKKYFFFRFYEIGNETETTAVIGLSRRINILI